MVKQFFKKKSKRVTTKTRCKIVKKVAAHNKKARRDVKKNPTKRKKDPGIPNSYPYKEDLLLQAEEHKKRLEEERERQKDIRKKNKAKLMDQKRNLQSLVSDAEKRTQQFDKKNAHLQGKAHKSGGTKVENSLKTYYKEFKKVVDAADVILEVLDARDPLGSRCVQVEEAVIAAGSNKKLVLVLNKIDLVPKNNVEAWLKYLRNELPTVAFKASTQNQKNNLSQSRVRVESASDDLRGSSCCIGADILMKLLANYCRSEDIKTAIRVGIVGFPNTGKSSIINSLKRSKACNVGATPGVTRSMQEVQLDKHVKLLDSPGIVMATGSTDAHVILRNCVRIQNLEDPVPAVSVVLGRCSKQQMMIHYGIASFSNVNEFLSLMAKRFGRLKKGGMPDVRKAARIVLQDWNTGKIRYHTQPPNEAASTHLDSQIVTQMSKQFDIDSLLSDEADALAALHDACDQDMVVDSDGPMAGLIPQHGDTIIQDEDGKEMEDSDAEMDQEDDGEWEEEEEKEKEEISRTTVTTKTKGAKLLKKGMKREVGKISAEMRLPANQKLSTARKQEFKKMKKNRRRNDAVAGSLSDALSGALSGLGGELKPAEDYDFSADY